MTPILKSLLTGLFIAWIPMAALAEVRLPQLINSGMVLQRNTDIPIWGWADPGEDLAVRFNGATYPATADRTGEWQVKLPKQSAGGPYTLEVRGENNVVTLKDILIGDVWVASGQSNMDLTMGRVEPLYPDEVRTASNSRIRYFEVPDRYNFKAPQVDLEGGKWEPVTPETIRRFSAAAYFFAKEIHQSQGVPVGIINASLGGSPVEAWISEARLKAFPEPYAELQRFKSDELIERITEEDRQRAEAWYQMLNKKDAGLVKGEYLWAESELEAGKWQQMDIPGYWEETAEGPLNGVVWFRKTIRLSGDSAGKEAKLILGRIVDADSVFVNGTLVGSTGYQYPPRRYTIPAGVLRAGDNAIAIRVISQQGRGGFVPDKAYELRIADTVIDLTGTWHYRVGATMPPLEPQTFVRWKPTGLYNGMIAPLLNYRITGVIWYQGESNVGNAGNYHERFAAMIGDWRDHWHQPAFPFLYVQLANFLASSPTPSDSAWARLREAQLKTLSVPKTGMAVAIDIGEWNDIHPLNKQAVGQRLAAVAKEVAYGEDGVHSGPHYESATVKGNKMILTFSNTGGGLVAKGGGKLQEVAIAGADRQFVWAQTQIQDDRIVVWSEDIKDPKAVRYAWADNPDNANLYNKEGFPASPFRTDAW